MIHYPRILTRPAIQRFSVGCYDNPEMALAHPPLAPNFAPQPIQRQILHQKIAPSTVVHETRLDPARTSVIQYSPIDQRRGNRIWQKNGQILFPGMRTCAAPCGCFEPSGIQRVEKLVYNHNPSLAGSICTLGDRPLQTCSDAFTSESFHY